jgi:hypothetical protein
MTSENLRTKILIEFEDGLIEEKELSNLLMQFAMQYHKEQCNIADVVQSLSDLDGKTVPVKFTVKKFMPKVSLD